MKTAAESGILSSTIARAEASPSSPSKLDGASSVAGNPSAADPPSPPCLCLAMLLHTLRPHAELDLTTIAYHLQQSDATAADGYCHASINEARSALEALVVGIAMTFGETDARLPGRGSNTPFSNWRRFLVETGLLTQPESDMLHFAYGLSSAKGSHHGVTDIAWTRLTRWIIFAASQYLLRRYAAWKQNGRPMRGPASPTLPPRRRLHRIVSRLLHFKRKPRQQDNGR